MGDTGRPIFVAIEGIDRVGKNAQAGLLAERLAALGRRVLSLTTPDYDTPTGKLVDRYLHGRVCLVDTADMRQDIGPLEAEDATVLEALMIVNRYEVAARVRSALESGSDVVCVRWGISAVLYGIEDRLGYWVEHACSFLPRPNLMLLLHAPAEAVAHRSDAGSRYEGRSGAQARIGHSYLRHWRKRGEIEGESWWVVDALGSADEVAERVWQAVRTRFPEVGR